MSGVLTVKYSRVGDPISKSTFFSEERTAANDKPFRLASEDLPFEDMNFHCYLKDAYYGNGAKQEATILVNDVAPFRNGNIRDIWFRNKTAGQNCKIVASGTLKV